MTHSKISANEYVHNKSAIVKDGRWSCLVTRPASVVLQRLLSDSAARDPAAADCCCR